MDTNCKDYHLQAMELVISYWIKSIQYLVCPMLLGLFQEEDQSVFIEISSGEELQKALEENGLRSIASREIKGGCNRALIGLYISSFQYELNNATQSRDLRMVIEGYNCRDYLRTDIPASTRFEDGIKKYHLTGDYQIEIDPVSRIFEDDLMSYMSEHLFLAQAQCPIIKEKTKV